LFEGIHVEKKDHWGTVTEWKNEDLLVENLELISVDAPPGARIELPEITYIPTKIDLVPGHLKAYEEIKEAQLQALPEELQELAIRAMFSVLQRAVLDPETWGAAGQKNMIVEYIKSVVDQSTEPMLIFCRHVTVVELLHAAIPGSVCVYGKTKDKQASIDAVKTGMSRVLIGNLDSMSVGLNAQFIQRMVFAELPFRADKFDQAVGRIWRQGQEHPCFIHVPLGKGTLQETIYYNLIKNDEDLSIFYKTKKKLVDLLTT